MFLQCKGNFWHTEIKLVAESVGCTFNRLSYISNLQLEVFLDIIAFEKLSIWYITLVNWINSLRLDVKNSKKGFCKQAYSHLEKFS